MIDEMTALSYSVFQGKGTYALLLGSGVSRSARIPTGWEITNDLARRLAVLSGDVDVADVSAWYRRRFQKEPNYSEIISELATTADERRAILHGYIEPSNEEFSDNIKVPTKAHKSIAALIRDGFVRVVVTTNFDRLLENSLREVGVEPTIIRSEDDIAGAVPLTHARCYVIKVHGDYLDTRIKNTDLELASYSNKMNSLLDRVFDEFGLVVCGWSAEWDSALRSAILRAPNRRYPTFWMTRGPLSFSATDLVASRDAKILMIEGADEAFKILQDGVATLASLPGRDPRSVELLIASAKRFITRAEFRIELEEMIASEVHQILLSTASFSAAGSWSPELFQQRVAAYEALAEASVRLFGVLGRWGDGAEFGAVSDAIRNLMRAEPQDGLTVLLNLRSYPARLLFFSYGIGLLKAERYEDIYRLFSETLVAPYKEDTTFLTSIVSWDGDDESWNLLAEFSGRKHRTPHSDHLHALFGRWANDYLVFQEAEFTRLFEAFELLGSLAYISGNADLKALQAAIEGNWGSAFVWAPLGRASWDGSTRNAILGSWKNPKVEAKLLSSGFAHSNSQYLGLAIKSIENLSQRIRW